MADIKLVNVGVTSENVRLVIGLEEMFEVEEVVC